MMQDVSNQRTQQFYQKIEFLLCGAFFCWLLYSIFFGERIPESGGVGYDGVLYAGLAQDFTSIVFAHKLSIYALQRVLPSGIIYYVAHLFHFSLTQATMPMVFSIYNTIILMFAVFVWHQIAKQLHWTPQVRLISFAGLFLNYAILKMNTYYPILTDTSAFFCGLLMVYLFLLDKKFFVLLTMIAGAFIFPTLVYVGFILFVVSNKQQDYLSQQAHSLRAIILALLSAIIITMCISMIYYEIGVRDEFALGRYSAFPVLCLSIASLFVYFFLSLLPVYNNFFALFIRSLKQFFNVRLLLALLVVIAIKSSIHSLSNGEAGPLTPALFVELISVRSLAYPLIFLVSHLIYYGPIVCLLIYFWRDVINALQNENLGLFLVAGCYIVLAINPESREAINFFPIAVIAVCQILNNKKIDASFVYFFLLLSLVVSRVWLPLNHGWLSLATNPPQVTLEFPMQWYFMSQGPWMSNVMYVVYAVVTLSVFAIIYPFTKSRIAN